MAVSELETLRQERDAAERRLATLSRVVTWISSELALEPLLTRIAESATELLGVPRSSIWLVDDRDGETVLRWVAGVNVPPREKGLTSRPGIGLAGTVVERQRPVRLDRYDELERPLVSDFGEKPVVSVPIWWGQRIIGVFSLAAEPPHRFSERDVETLILFARHAAVAIENARRFEAEQRRLARVATINRIGRLLTSNLGFDALFQTAVEAISESFGFAYLGAGTVDPDDPSSLVLLAAGGKYADLALVGYRHRADRGLLGVATRTRQRVLVSDVTRDRRHLPLPGAEGIRAALVVPIVMGDRLLGLLDVQSEHPIDEEEAEAVEIIADQLGAALENARLLGGLQRALTTTRLLYQISQRLTTAMTVSDVVTAYLEQIAAGGQYHCSVRLDEFDNQGRRTAVIVHGRWTREGGLRVGEERLPYLIEYFDAVLDAGQVVAVRDYRHDPRLSPELRALQASVGRRSFALIPLIVRGRRIGRLNLSCEEPHDWSEAELQPFQVTAALLAAALESRQQAVQLSQQGQQLAVLEERRRLARELHDSVTQALSSMSLLAQAVPDLWEIDREEGRRALAQIREQTRAALTEMRALLFELRPADEGGWDLPRSLRHHASTFEQRTGVPVALDLPDTLDLPDDVAYALARIAQEALTNVARHAAASKVTLTLAAGPPVRLVIADDGRGFEPRRVAGDHLGLVSMRERAAGVKARLQVQSRPGQGTRITVEWAGSPS